MRTPTHRRNHHKGRWVRPRIFSVGDSSDSFIWVYGDHVLPDPSGPFDYNIAPHPQDHEFQTTYELNVLEVGGTRLAQGSYESGYFGIVGSEPLSNFPPLTDVILVEATGIYGGYLGLTEYPFTNSGWGIHVFYDDANQLWHVYDGSLITEIMNFSATNGIGNVWHVGMSLNTDTGTLAFLGDATMSPVTSPALIPDITPRAYFGSWGTDFVDGYLGGIGVDTSGTAYPLLPDLTVDFDAPAEPSGLTFIHDVNGISVSWDANTEPDFDHYVITIFDEEGVE